MTRLLLASMASALLMTLLVVQTTSAQSGGLLPDLKTDVPSHLQLVNKQQKEVLRFSNGVANTGEGPLQVRPVIPSGDPSQTQDAVQQILDADGNVVQEAVVSQYVFHPTHNHWHIGDVALFEVRAGSPAGPVVGTSVKITSCLIDWIKISDNSPSHERVYWECNADFQGISPGWIDQYHQSLDGMGVDVTGIPAGRYYLVSTANPLGAFIEEDETNNAAWVSFDLTRDSNGNAKIREVGHSACEPGLCGESNANR